MSATPNLRPPASTSHVRADLASNHAVVMPSSSYSELIRRNRHAKTHQTFCAGPGDVRAVTYRVCTKCDEKSLAGHVPTSWAAS